MSGAGTLRWRAVRVLLLIAMILFAAHLLLYLLLVFSGLLSRFAAAMDPSGLLGAYSSPADLAVQIARFGMWAILFVQVWQYPGRVGSKPFAATGIYMIVVLVVVPVVLLPVCDIVITGQIIGGAVGMQQPAYTAFRMAADRIQPLATSANLLALAGSALAWKRACDARKRLSISGGAPSADSHSEERRYD